MSGYPEFNFPSFNNKAAELRSQGWTVFNPAEKDEEATLDPDAVKTGDAVKAIEKGFDFREAYTWDVNRVIEADAIYMLPGWEQSPGARGEHAVASAMKKHFPEYQIIYG
jgi:hypothetical protein